MESDKRAKQLAIKTQTPSTSRARKGVVKHPLSLRLPEDLEARLRKEAKQVELSLRDYIRQRLAERRTPAVTVEEVGAGHIKVLTQKLDEVAKAPLMEVKRTLEVELHELRSKVARTSPEEVARRVHESVKDLLERSRQEPKQVVKDRVQDVERDVFGWPYIELQRLLITAAISIMLSLMSVILAVSFIHGVYPWETGEIAKKFIAAHIPEHICFAPAVRNEDGSGTPIKRPTPGASQNGGKR